IQLAQSDCSTHLLNGHRLGTLPDETLEFLDRTGRGNNHELTFFHFNEVNSVAETYTQCRADRLRDRDLAFRSYGSTWHRDILPHRFFLTIGKVLRTPEHPHSRERPQPNAPRSAIHLNPRRFSHTVATPRTGIPALEIQ